jgi:transcriptional regulator with XRE-family HTH domain
VYIDEQTAATLEPVLAAEYRRELSRRAKQAITDLSPHIAQAELERLADISQGYLSRIYRGHGTPSTQLVLLLAVLAQDPTLLEWVSRYWGEPSSQEACLRAITTARSS